MSAVAVSDSLIDTLFDGRYRIERKLGAGGMADVYLAEDQELGRRVAIKILNSRHGNDDQFIERFRREAKNAAALNHPNIVSIYDRGEAEDTYYIAMEYLDGRTLKELIVGRGAAPINVAVEYARQILSALRFAHRHGIVHRDIKPHNVLVDGEGRVKVTDFGIARAGTSQMTETGSIVGTAQYLSPEQARGGEVDPRSDLYSLGIVLYELLTGRDAVRRRDAGRDRDEAPLDGSAAALEAAARRPARARHGRHAGPREESGRPVPERRRDGGRPRPGRARRAGLGDDRRHGDAGLAAPCGSGGGGGGSGDRRNDDCDSPRRSGAGVPPAVVEEERRRNRTGRSGRGSSRSAVVVAALVAGFFVWHQLSGSTPQVPVNNYVNEPVARAKQQITAAGLVADPKKGSSERYKQGIVFKQDPGAGTKVDKGGTVTIWVSTGPPKVKMPDVKGQQWTQAEANLVNVGLKPVRHNVPGNTAGQVTATSPAANELVPKGSTVRVNVMTGPAPATVPNVVGDTLSTALDTLRNAGFNPNPSYVDSDAPQNQVISQNPTPNTSSTKGTTVNLKVSNGPPQVNVPSVVGETAQQAVSDLQSLGFVVNQQPVSVSDPSENGIVISQNPDGGTSALKGSTVTIEVGQHSPAPPPTTTTTPSG